MLTILLCISYAENKTEAEESVSHFAKAKAMILAHIVDFIPSLVHDPIWLILVISRQL